MPIRFDTSDEPFLAAARNGVRLAHVAKFRFSVAYPMCERQIAVCNVPLPSQYLDRKIVTYIQVTSAVPTNLQEETIKLIDELEMLSPPIRE